MTTKMETGEGVQVDQAVVEAYAMALVAKFEADSHAPALCTSGDRGGVKVKINGCLDTIEYEPTGSRVLSSFEAIEAAIALLAGAHAVRVIRRREDADAIA